MNAELKSKIEVQVRQIIKFANDQKYAADKLKEHKEKLTELCDSSFDEIFNDDGVLKLENAGVLVKTALNPPKLVSMTTDKSLSPAEREELAKALIAKKLENLTVLDIEIKDLQAAADTNKIVAKLLKDKKILIEQDTRYEVKPLPKKS